MFRFDTNFRKIADIYRQYDSGLLRVDRTYQRRSVWGEKDKIRLIETILLNLVIPEVFFWEAQTDPDSGESTTHIVDGQQRIQAIAEFINNSFRLKPQYMLENEAKLLYGNKNFIDLDPQVRSEFWGYKLSVVEIDPKATLSDIAKMFRRLNLTDYNLNDQEKRNSIAGEFSSLCREIAGNRFWDDFYLFRSSDIRRMKDVEFAGSIILLSRRGIIDQSDQQALNEAYDDYKNGYDDAEKDRQAVETAIDMLRIYINADTLKFLQRKTQLYTFFSVIFYMIQNGISYSDESSAQLKAFVSLYSRFDNNIELSEVLTEDERFIFDLLKKYKLASSEGLNKYTNRSIRKDVLKKFMFEANEDIKIAQETLNEKLIRYSSQFEVNGLDTDIDEDD